MKSTKRWTGLAVLAISLACLFAPTSAFVLTSGRPSENVSGARARAPGLMVNRGIARHSTRFDDFQSPNEITATSETQGLVDLFLPQWIEVIFEQLNAGLELLINALFVRAGETPPALSALSNTTIPATKLIEPLNHSLRDRALDRLDRNAQSGR